MIAIDDFKSLTFNKKCDFITVFADYLACKTEMDRKYYLYHLNGYFVEVCYAPYESRVREINAFRDSSGLGPYLEEINIETGLSV